MDSGGQPLRGGDFTTAGGVAANHIAKWDGSAWSALGSGMNGNVLALTLDSSGNLYAGGDFTIAGGKPSAYAAYAVLSQVTNSPVGDDFNDNIKDPAKWGADTGPGRLVETNARLEYTTTDDALRPWIASVGSYTQDWEAVADVHVGNVALTQDDVVGRDDFISLE